MVEERRLTIPAVLSQIPVVCGFVAEAAESTGLDDRASYHCQMALDEWCTNIIEHGFGGEGNSANIEIVLRLEPVQLTMTVIDDGPPFDPTVLPEADTSRPLEDREPGGLGWFFIIKTMSEVKYAYRSKRNVLTMVKRGERANAMPELAPSPFPVKLLDDGVLVMSPVGRLDSFVGRKLEDALQGQIEQGHNRIVVEMKDVTYISSTGLKALLNALRRLQMRGGSIALSSLMPRVLETFQMSGFDSLFVIKPTAQDAALAVTSA